MSELDEEEYLQLRGSPDKPTMNNNNNTAILASISGSLTSKLDLVNHSSADLVQNGLLLQRHSSDNLRFGDEKHRKLLEYNASPVLPKTDIQIEVNNPSTNSIFQYKQQRDQHSQHSNPLQLDVIAKIARPYQLSLNSPNSSQIQSPLPKMQLDRFRLSDRPPPRMSQLNLSGNASPFLSLQASLLAKRFAQKLKLKARSQLFLKLTDRQFKMIGDLSSYVQYYRKTLNPNTTHLTQAIRAIKNMFSSFLDSETLVFQPNSRFQILWSIVNFLFVTSMMLLVPLRYCFEVDIIDSYEQIMNFAIIFLGANIFIQLNQGIYKRGVLIKNRRLIIINYIKKSKFWLDLLIFIAFLIAMTHESYESLRLLTVFKIGFIMETYDHILSMLEIKQKNSHYGVFLKIVFQILLIAHLAGCFFIKLGLYNPDRNWIRTANLSYTDYAGMYTSAIYWSVITMITVGYGDITPTNNHERIYVIFVSIFSCGIFGYSLNIIGQIIRSKEESKLRFQTKINDLTDFMKKRQVNRDMRETVLKYFHYINKEEAKETYEVSTMISTLPETIKSPFQIDLYHHMFKAHSFFEETFSDNFLLKMCSLIKEKKIGPETILGDIDKDPNSASTANTSSLPADKSLRLYFILNGKVSFQTSKHSDRIMKIFEVTHLMNIDRWHDQFVLKQKGEILGLEEFITGQRTHMAPVLKSQTVVMLAYINKSEFLQLLEANPSDKEQFCMKRDRVGLSCEFPLIRQKCLSCQGESHSASLCERLHFQVNRDKMLYSQNSSSNMERKPSFARFANKRKSLFAYDNLDDSLDGVVAAPVQNLQTIQNNQLNNMNNNPQSDLQHPKLEFMTQYQTTNIGRKTAKRRQTNQTRVNHEGSIDQRRPLVKIKEHRAENSIGGIDYDLMSIQNRSKRAHSELQFPPDAIFGSHLMMAHLSPKNGNQASALDHSNLLSNHPQNDILDDRNSQNADDLNQSFGSIFKKRDAKKKQSKKAKGNIVFNIDDLRIKKSGIMSSTTAATSNHFTNVHLSAAVPQKQIQSYQNIPEGSALISEEVSQHLKDIHGSSQYNNNHLQSSLQMPSKLESSNNNPAMAAALQQAAAIQNMLHLDMQQLESNYMSRGGGPEEDQMYDDDFDNQDSTEAHQEGEIVFQSVIQMFQYQIIALKESKVIDIDMKKAFKVYFPESNYDTVIHKLSKIMILPLSQRSPGRQNRKQSRFRTGLLPLTLNSRKK